MSAVERTAMPPNDYTVTKIRHTHDLQKISGMIAGDANKQNSSEWLMGHSVKAMHLTIEDLIEKGR